MCNLYKGIVFLSLSILLLIPLEVYADYSVDISFFTEGGSVSSGNVDVVNEVVFVKDDIKASVNYKKNETIKHLNSLDKKTTFSLKKNGKDQTKNKEWCAFNINEGKKVCFSNSKQYKARDIVKALDLIINIKNMEKGIPVDVFLYANYGSEKSSKKSSAVKVKSVELNYKKIGVNVGKKVSLRATIKPSNSSNKKVTWKSKDTSIATVDFKGNVKGIKKGTTKIVVTTNDGKKIAECIVAVSDKKDYNVKLIYNVNGGRFASIYRSDISINNNTIYYGNNNIIHNMKYRDTLSSTGLADYNNPHCINLTKKGYIIKNGIEWNTKPDGTGKSYDQRKIYKASDFCNAKDKDCTVTLYANWKVANIKTINLATFNIGFFNCGGSKFNCYPTADTFSNLISSNNIDIIGLQEARTKYYFLSKSNRKKSYETIKSIGKKAGLNNNYLVSPKNTNAILSKYSLNNKKEIPLSSCVANGKAVEDRSIQKTIIRINGVDISYYNTHLDYHPSCAEKHMRDLANVVKKDNNPIIITADYNNVEKTNYENYLKPLGFEVAANDTKFKGVDGSISYMDSVYVLSKNVIDIESAKTIVTYKKSSDHNLVIARLSIKK